MISKKRARSHDSAEEDEDTVIKDLQELIHELSGEPLSLILLSSFAARKHSFSNTEKSSYFGPSTSIKGDVESTTESDHHIEQARKEELALFERYIGPYEDVLSGVFHHVDIEYADEILFNVNFDLENDRHLDPEFVVAQGPRLDMHVLVGLFLGEDAEEKSREEFEREDEEGEVCYSNVYQAFRRNNGDARKMPILEVARNILQYLAEQAKTMELERLLYFCATYGLSSAAQNVLDGKYGEIGSLTIDTPLLIPRKRESLDADCPRLPFLGVASVLGYHHAVRYAVETLRANIHALPTKVNGIPMDYRGDVGVLALYWCINKNQPEMVKTLTDIGVQFRWLTNYRLDRMFHLLFHIDQDRDEYGPVWLPRSSRKRDDDFDDRRAMRRSRAKKCYKEKQKMLSAVIDAGMPKDLFIPSNIDFAAVKQKADKLAKAEGLDGPNDEIWAKVNKNNTKEEEATIEIMNGACIEYNSVRKKEMWLDVFEFAQYVDGLFLVKDGKPRANAQHTSLEEYESFDPRWKQREEEGNGRLKYWWEDRDDMM